MDAFPVARLIIDASRITHKKKTHILKNQAAVSPNAAPAH
jgi:hypothetical protein